MIEELFNLSEMLDSILFDTWTLARKSKNKELFKIIKRLEFVHTGIESVRMNEVKKRRGWR